MITGLLPPFDDEMVYSFHHYIGSSSDSVTSSNPSHWMHQYITDISIQYDVPLWIGEFGENSNHWAFNKRISLKGMTSVGAGGTLKVLKEFQAFLVMRLPMSTKYL